MPDVYRRHFARRNAFRRSWVPSRAAITYVDAPSGTLTLTGSATDAKRIADTQTGTLSLTGSNTEAKVYTDAASGTITLAGAAVEAHTGTDSQTGTLTLTGTNAEAHGVIYQDAQTGTLTLTGSNTDAATYTDQPAGTISLDGTGSAAAPTAITVVGGSRVVRPIRREGRPLVFQIAAARVAVRAKAPKLTLRIALGTADIRAQAAAATSSLTLRVETAPVRLGADPREVTTLATRTDQLEAQMARLSSHGELLQNRINELERAAAVTFDEEFAQLVQDTLLIVDA